MKRTCEGIEAPTDTGLFLQQDPIPPRWREMNRYIYGSNNPLRLTDPLGRDPYDRFFSRDDAARDINKYARTAFDPQIEHGGVLRYEGGMYYYDTEISHGDEDTVCIKWTEQGNESAVFHTHPDFSGFSEDDDLPGARRLGLDMYVGQPDGGLLLFDVRTGGLECR